MGKCELRIAFDRDDRCYQAGETIHGTVLIDVGQDFSCDRLVVQHFWRAHGKGNTRESEARSITLAVTTFHAGESLEIPFEFTAPDGPPTYHGRYLNVDQYVKVTAQIPWAPDPKHEEDYLLVAGDLAWDNRPTGFGKSASHTIQKSLLFVIGTVFLVAGVFFAASVLLFFPFGLIFAAIGAFLLFLAMRNTLAAKKLGPIEIDGGPMAVTPGGRIPLRVRFAPPKPLTITAITAKLVGKEECVSGSGTNQTTHTHVFYQKMITLASAVTAAGGEPIELSQDVEIPETDAYSFEAVDNKLVWSLEVRFHIPRWPDWIKEFPLLVRPATAAATIDSAPVEVVAVEEVPDAEVPAPVWSVPEAIASDPLPPPPEQSEQFEPRPEAGMGLVELVEQLASAPRYGPDREKLLAPYLGQSFDCTVAVSDVAWTFGSVPEAFRKGRTLVGTLAGSQCKVAVQMSADKNESLENAGPGAQVEVRAEVWKWNVIYDRIELREVV